MLRSIDAPWGQDEIFYLDSPPRVKYQFEFNGQMQTCFIHENRLEDKLDNRLDFIITKTAESLQTGCYKFISQMFDIENFPFPQTIFAFIEHGKLKLGWHPQKIIFNTLGSPNDPNSVMSLEFSLDDVHIDVCGSVYKKKAKDWIYGKKAELVRAVFTSLVGINRQGYEYHYTKSCRTKASMAAEPAWLTDDLLLDYNHYASLLEEYSIYEKY